MGKLKKFLGVTSVVLGTAYVGVSALAKAKKKSEMIDEDLHKDEYIDAGKPVEVRKKSLYESKLNSVPWYDSTLYKEVDSSPIS